jgi:hypothetical protein
MRRSLIYNVMDGATRSKTDRDIYNHLPTPQRVILIAYWLLDHQDEVTHQHSNNRVRVISALTEYGAGQLLKGDLNPGALDQDRPPWTSSVL